MVVARILALVAPVRLPVRYPLAQILDDARALADAAQRESSLAVHGGVAYLEQRLPGHVRPPPAPLWRDDTDNPRTRSPRKHSRTKWPACGGYAVAAAAAGRARAAAAPARDD